MWSFLSEFTRDPGTPYTIIVMDVEGMEQPRQYQVLPRNLLWLLGGTAVALFVLGLSIVLFTPLQKYVGYNTEELRQQAAVNDVRVQALQDSLTTQQQYMHQLRRLILGDVDSTFMSETVVPLEVGPSVSGEAAELAADQAPDWADHQQPALAVEQMPVKSGTPFRSVSAGARYLPGIQLPTLPPVDGFLTRGFDARGGHYAVDLAVQEGTMVRAIGDGYVIFSDWTHEGGYAIAVQHADGYVSVYKHNQQLLKRVGERVRSREAIAMSGNSGEVSTGPHLHFELWHEGLAQDPRYYFIGG